MNEHGMSSDPGQEIEHPELTEKSDQQPGMAAVNRWWHGRQRVSESWPRTFLQPASSISLFGNVYRSGLTQQVIR